MTDPRHVKGSWGEHQAALYLKSKGFAIDERNWKAGRHEIDIIGSKDGILVFFEIKTRSSKSFLEDVQLVSHAQQQRIWQAAEQYMFQTDYGGEIRFDILMILIDRDKIIRIDHYEDAFFPDWG